MEIMLGNLSVPQIEKRLGIEFPQEIREFMLNSRQEEAQKIKVGKWHCFDLPFQIVFGDLETATKVYNALKDQGDKCKEQLHFGIQG